MWRKIDDTTWVSEMDPSVTLRDISTWLVPDHYILSTPEIGRVFEASSLARAQAYASCVLEGLND